MVLENTTTLRVGDVTVLHIPSDRGNLHPDNAAWPDVLTLVRQSGLDLTFRAVRPGTGVIMFSPYVPDGGCISCVTVHYFVTVVSRE
jgi:hypothetical protein